MLHQNIETMPHVYEDIYKIVRRIPKGRVLTYGLISNMIDSRMSAQGVGWALKALGSAKPAKNTTKTKATTTFDISSVPWHRVVNSQGGTSTHKIPDIPPDLQRHLLEAEGITFDDEGKLDLHKYLWTEGLNGHPNSKPKATKTKRTK